jgi:hypothetical protein
MPIAEKVYKSLHRERLVEIDKKVKEETAIKNYERLV